MGVPFDPRDGTPTVDADGDLSTAEKMVWDLRPDRRVRLTGGPYAGDVGRIVGKNDAGHYRIRFENSVNSTFKAKLRPFSLWLGNWWLEEATKGYGICPGGKIPFVNVVDDAVVGANEKGKAATSISATELKQPEKRGKG